MEERQSDDDDTPMFVSDSGESDHDFVDNQMDFDMIDVDDNNIFDIVVIVSESEDETWTDVVEDDGYIDVGEEGEYVESYAVNEPVDVDSEPDATGNEGPDEDVTNDEQDDFSANTEPYTVNIIAEPDAAVASAQSVGAVVNAQSDGAVVNAQLDGAVVNAQSDGAVANAQSDGAVANSEASGNHGPINAAVNDELVIENIESNNVPVPSEPHNIVVNNEASIADASDGRNEVPSKEDIEVPDNQEETEKATSKVNSSYEEDGMMCTICFEPWTCSGEHRLVSLRCGHLFGRSCIAKWVKNRDAKCPQCNARARKSEIRPIYAKAIKTLDTSERDYALKELEKESLKRKRAELETARKKLECDMIRQEIEGLKKELMFTQMQLKEVRTGQKDLGKLAQSRFSQKAFSRILQVDMKLGGCRVMDCSSILGMLAVSQPSLNNIFRGYGLRKISVPDVTLCEFVHVHQKQIKDVSFHSTDGLILSASLDKTVKIVNFLTNSIVQTYNLDCDVWSCSWDLDDPKYFYAGGRTGSVYVYDIRMTDRQLCQLSDSEERSPVVSLQYLKRQPSAKHSKCGPIIGQLGSCCFYEKVPSTNPFTYVAKPLPLEGKFTSLSCESTTGHLLASCRPSQKHPKATHTLCELSYDMNAFSCNFVHAMVGGSTQIQLTRSKLMLHPDNDSTVLVCAGDEESKSTLVWNGCTGSLLDRLPADSPTLDVTTFRWDKPVLATLTDKNVYFYNWNSV